MKMFINSLYRMTPGVLTFAAFTAVMLVGWSMGMYTVFSPYIYEYRDFLSTVNEMSFGILPLRPEFVRFNEENSDLTYIGAAGILLQFIYVTLLVVFITLCSYLFKLSVAFERY